MQFELFDFQRTAAQGVLANLGRGRDDWARHRSQSSFALSAITGAGKTVIASAAIEAIIHGSSDLGTEADPRAVFLWVTYDPALNRQTRAKMLAASDMLAPSRLVVLENDFMDTELAPGRVYFLNSQKLSKNSGLASGGRNLRQLSMWDVLANTINGERADLYLVLDEAHQGMKQAADRRTIVNRIISGQPGSNPAVPVVWGISATIALFAKAMEGITDRTSYPSVEVDIEKVQISGLVKDEIGIDQPNEKGTFSTTLLRDAVDATLDFERRWARYSADEAEPLVLPVLVVQVPDKASHSKLAEIVGVIESQWPGLAGDAIVNVFGEHETITIADRNIEWVQPESIHGDADIRVVLAKEAISTGWDCPRAEVLYSERPAKDATHIAQVVGRMVRQPLAHRIATHDALNSVACYLPLFDRNALSAIKNELEGKGGGTGDNQVGPEVVRAPRVFDRNPSLAPGVAELIESLPSITSPDPLASPFRRAKTLVRLLSDDATGTALLPDAEAVLTAMLNAKLDGLAAQHAKAVAENVHDINTAEVTTSTLTTTGREVGTNRRVAMTHHKDIDRDTRKTLASVKEGVAKDYYAYRVREAAVDADKLDIRIEVAALLRVEGVVAEVEAAATRFVQDRLTEFAVEIRNTTGATRDAFLKVREQSSHPEVVTVELRDNEKTATKDLSGDDLPSFKGHVFSDEGGNFPVRLNDWEKVVLRTEIDRPSFVAWYRNPSRAMANALRVAYEDDAGKWSSLQVDFIVISQRDDGSLAASIVDPHGDHLADAKAKLRALADFAETYDDRFLRIESIAKTRDGTLRTLDLRSARVRSAVRTFEGGKVTALYESDVATDYM